MQVSNSRNVGRSAASSAVTLPLQASAEFVRGHKHFAVLVKPPSRSWVSMADFYHAPFALLLRAVEVVPAPGQSRLPPVGDPILVRIRP
jgi:hypothetical protein